MPTRYPLNISSSQEDMDDKDTSAAGQEGSSNFMSSQQGTDLQEDGVSEQMQPMQRLFAPHPSQYGGSHSNAQLGANIQQSASTGTYRGPVHTSGTYHPLTGQSLLIQGMHPPPQAAFHMPPPPNTATSWFDVNNQQHWDQVEMHTRHETSWVISICKDLDSMATRDPRRAVRAIDLLGLVSAQLRFWWKGNECVFDSMARLDGFGELLAGLTAAITVMKDDRPDDAQSDGE